MKTKPPLWYTVQAIVGTILEEAALVAIVLWVLPYYFDIHIPLWGLIALVVAFAIFCYVTYRIGKPTFFLKPKVAPEAIIGKEGIVVKPLAPEGYVKVQGVLWKAICGESADVDDEVIVVELDGLKLIVCRKEERTQPSKRGR